MSSEVADAYGKFYLISQKRFLSLFIVLRFKPNCAASIWLSLAVGLLSINFAPSGISQLQRDPGYNLNEGRFDGIRF